MKIKINSADFSARSGVGKASGKAYTIREQDGLYYPEGADYALPVKISLPDEMQVGYPPGWYTVDESKSIGIDRFMKLEFKFGGLHLKPSSAPAGQRAA